MRLMAYVTVVLAISMAGCGDPSGQQAAPTTAATATDAPTETPQPRPSPTQDVAQPTEPTGAQTVEVWYARDTNRGVVVEPEIRTLDEPTAAVARAAIEELVSTQPQDPELDNIIPDDTRVLDVTLRDQTLVVDLDLPDDTMPGGAAAEAAGYQQIAHTGAQFATVRRVRVLEEGQTPDSGHLDLENPFEPDEFAISPIVVTSPTHDEEVDAGDVTVSGHANVFEATVELRLIDPDGEVVEETFTTATCGSGCRGDWEHTFSGVTAPGSWTVVAVEPDASDGEGSGPFVTQRSFTVR